MTAERTSTAAASSRLFGDLIDAENVGYDRGETLRYVLRALYGADYVKRGAKLLGIAPSNLRHALASGERCSRRLVDRLADKLADRVRHRRGELRAAAAAVEAAFAAEYAALSRCPELVLILSRLASVAANTRQPHSRETGRFVSRAQGKLPDLRERPAKKARGEPK